MLSLRVIPINPAE